MMTPYELKSMPKGQFIVMKTGFYPMKIQLKLYFKWGITFEEEYTLPERGNRTIVYASKDKLMAAISKKYGKPVEQQWEQNPIQKLLN